jgi:glutamyl-tRNA reductase
MNVILVGLNHKTAPIEIRERISISEDHIGESLHQLLEFSEIKEAMILSTCNRVEVLLHGTHVHRVVDVVKDLFSDNDNLERSEINKYLYAFVDNEAVDHLFRVTSSLDAMVVGEPQILGQVKDAYRTAVDCRTCGPILNKLLHYAFRVAKRVRTETGIARNAVSVSYAAVALARNIFESLAEKAVFLIGAGEMIELAARHFVEQGVSRILITNRTYSRAELLAVEFGGEAIPFEDFRKRLTEVDIILSCTGAQAHIIDAEDVKRTLKLRKNRSMFFIDIAVPRDVDPEVNQLENAYLYDIDDLQNIVDSNIAQRKNEIAKANRIIEREVKKFSAWVQSLEVTPTIKGLREMAENVRRQELMKTLRQLKHLNEDDQESLESMSRAIVNKILHPAITQIKREGGVNGQKIYVDLARKLFGLDDVNQNDS